MKAKELTIGNWVQYDGIPCQIESLTKVDAVVRRAGIFDFDNRSLENAHPIELTEEVLVKIGFEKLEKLFRMKLSKFHLDYFIAVGVLRIYKKLTDCYFDKNLEFKCEYLHQLQNAYYLLTNEELEVEL